MCSFIAQSVDNRTGIMGIEWSLRAFASMRAVRLFLRARVVINFVLRAASTLEITNGEQRGLRKFSANLNLSLLKPCLRQVIWLISSKRITRPKLGNMLRCYRGSTTSSGL